MKLLFLLIVASATIALSAQQPSQQLNPVGRWQVKFTLLSSPEKNLVFTAQDGGEGTFKLLDTGPDDKPVAVDQAAAWSLTNGHLSITGEVELPIGTCCRETGTLIFKSKPTSADSFSGKLIFVTNIDEDESPYKYHATAGTFTATRIRKE
jgi:hypothetical protein